MEKLTVYCLHGFLGRPSDWDPLDPCPYDLRKIDLFEVLSPASGASMTDWAERFNSEVRAEKRATRVLLGYSMGGRLALHSLVADPALWDAAVIISANPGLPEMEKKARLAQDEAWARRFESEPWDQLIHDWNALPVFNGSAPVAPRSEECFQRTDLAAALRVWSPARTPDLTDRINPLQKPLAWIAGANDRRYCEIAEKMAKSTASRSFEAHILASAGHRAPWDQPAAWAEYFCGFLDRSLLKVGH
ncbi:MAG: alpha/beta fold hydrolase [Oligoflexia bacterium]|nr:alpha/beta fold hydrolase [Oligoflexia bacterium]